MCIFIKNLRELKNIDVVYFYMKESKCLYVGKTQNVQQRHNSHSKDEYSKQADRLIIYTYENFLDASLAEIYYINIKYPVFNHKDKIDNGYIYAHKYKKYFEDMHKNEYCFLATEKQNELIEINNIKEEKNKAIQKNNNEAKEKVRKKKSCRGEQIYQVDRFEDKILNCFNTQKEALKFIGKIGCSGISDAINERKGCTTHFAYGYRWYYKKDLPFKLKP